MNMGDEANAAFQFDLRTDHAVRPDLDALADTRAIGDARGRIDRHLFLGHDRANFGLCDQRAADLRFGAVPPHVAAPRDLVDVIFERVARDRRLAEFGLVYGQEKNRARILAGRHVAQAQHARGLRHTLDHQHARHDRVAGKMAEEMRLVEGDILDADAMLVAAHVDDTVDHEKRVAVRQQPQDFADIGDAEGFYVHPSSPSVLPRPRASFLSTATPFMKSRIGWAGDPTQRSPAGTSVMTPAFAPSKAPAPTVVWAARPTCPPIITKSPTSELPDMPTCPAIKQCRPMRTLCAICTRLSILVPSPMTVSRVEPRSIVQLAPISTSS